jgi:hypothetical protein
MEQISVIGFGFFNLEIILSKFFAHWVVLLEVRKIITFDFIWTFI